MNLFFTKRKTYEIYGLLDFFHIFFGAEKRLQGKCLPFLWLVLYSFMYYTALISLTDIFEVFGCFE